jgi:hypothetical protein
MDINYSSNNSNNSSSSSNSNSNNSSSVFYDPYTDTFIPIYKPIIDKNERVIWDFTFGVQIDTTNENENENEHENEHESEKQNFENAVTQITAEITQITDGLTYKYCYGTWLQKNKIILESSNSLNEKIFERNLNVQISVIVLPETANDIYNLVKNIISKVNKTYNLGLQHIQAMKTIGTAHHFMC